MKVLIAIDSSPVSQGVIDEAVARPWPASTTFCVVNAIDVTHFAELPALIENATREGERLVKAGVATLTRAGLAAAHLTKFEFVSGEAAQLRAKAGGIGGWLRQPSMTAVE